MRKWLTHLLLLVATISVSLPASAQEARQRKPNPALVQITDVEGLPRVLLLGDSISIGYTLEVRKLLEGVANVHRPTENCGPTIRGLERLDKWLGEGKWDVIHFNFGLHDLKYLAADGDELADPQAPGSRQQVPPEMYAKNLEAIVQRLKSTGAKLIWCSTTPVPAGADGRVPGDDVKYNEIAAAIMQQHGIPTDDLYTFANAGLDELQRPKNVHFSPEGSQALAEQVAAKVREALAQ